MIRKTFVIRLTVALCAVFLIRPAATEVVNIPDANLRAAINETLNKKSEAAAITKSEMQSLTKLRRRDLSDLGSHRIRARHKSDRTAPGLSTKEGPGQRSRMCHPSLA